MPQFRTRDEYEKWKAERTTTSTQEVAHADSPPSSAPSPGPPLGVRMVAAVLDYIVIPMVLMGPLASVLSGFEATVTFSLLYYILPWRVWGSSLGKRITGLSIVTANGTAPGLGQSLLRLLMLFVFGTITGLFVLLRHDRRGLHDLAAGTRVVFTGGQVRTTVGFAFNVVIVLAVFGAFIFFFSVTLSPLWWFRMP